MVKSSSSCFKIITCGSDSVDQDEYEPIQGKPSTDKRGWSFRKRSARHRVLSNTVITESPSSNANKESPESTSINFSAPNNFTSVPDKISVWTNEAYPVSNVANPNSPGPIISTKDDSKIDQISSESACRSFTTENVNKPDPKLEESSALVIQAAIRGYLARRALLKKLRNVVKLQAAVRGHLVRNQAMGTLRCVQAITKMQALVRARRARMSLQGLAIEEKQLDGRERNNQTAKESLQTKESRNYSPTKKLLTNGFARQIMESVPKKKQIHIKCDPLQPDSSWKWLERWMSVSSSDLEEHSKPQLSSQYLEQGGRIDNAVSEVENERPSEVGSASMDLKSNISDTAKSLDSEENLITYDADNFVFQASRSLSSTGNDIEQPWVDDVDSRHAYESSSKIDLSSAEMLPSAASQTMSSSILSRSEVDNEQPKRSMKRAASEQPEVESKKYGFGSRKTSNPAFVAVQSKFEGLSSTATSNRSISSTSQDVGAESKVDRSSSVDILTKFKEPSQKENPVSHEPRIQIGGSDCGSVLSITSTLDSPDRSEVGVGDFEQETGLVEVTSDLSTTTDNASDVRNLDVGLKTDAPAPVSQSNLSVPASFQSRNDENVNLGSIDISTQQVEQQSERSASGVHVQVDNVTDQREYRSSPEGSPTRSHVTIPESYGTPSSQVSTNAKRSKLNGSGGTQSRKSQSINKRPPSSRDPDSGARSSTEQLPKESKTGKRRSSFGSSRTDHVDQEPRDSSSTLPSYMQATESARAKALANVSPRASPDVQDKDVYIKKRHSLPGTNGKQGSPRMQRSASQVQQNAKGSGSHSPHEKKWQR